jgi:glutathione-dependent peroxiredoxin
MLPTAESLEGKPVPQVTFKARPDNQWRDISTDELFKDKTVVVFSLPGAYTPTCSSTHLPRYNELSGVFRENGVDDILCLSVNDAFVMNEWKQGQEADGITFIPDGNGDFAHGMGMLVDKRELGFGMRSWRYSMLVRDGIIEKIFIEEEGEDDPFKVSDADTMLRHINPEARAPEPIVMFSRPGQGGAVGTPLALYRYLAGPEDQYRRAARDHGPHDLAASVHRRAPDRRRRRARRAPGRRMITRMAGAA